MTLRFPRAADAGSALQALLMASGIKRDQIAAAAKLSRGTIANALRGDGSTETWEAIVRAAESLPGSQRAGAELTTLSSIVFPKKDAVDADPPDREANAPPRNGGGQGRSGHYWIATALLVVAVGAWAMARPAKPRLLVDGQSASVRTQGQTFQFQAAGFRPCSDVTRLVTPPNYPNSEGRTTLRLGARSDQAGKVRFSIAGGCDTMDAEYRIRVIEDQTQRQTNEVLATLTSNPRCGSHLPDLTATVTVDRTEVAVGQFVKVQVAVTNAGGMSSEPTFTKLRWGPAARTTVGDEAIDTIATPSIAPGSTIMLTVDAKVPESLSLGIYSVWVVLDNTDAILESRVWNNFSKSAPLHVESRRVAPANLACS